ncbi:TIGR02587 family membrane protein [Ciceribacter sp. L1K22]|uniref:TIGR02587 family membrane protein n=1 Tax=Ciceribacter sp. L1K22 TaxID=2820275 RepID=UPI001ABEB689|nr:TIGR02587 family membrane protein [Ciceribacter sp. L1K22]MBO3760836.1 TIGR02587 family membrane protein [Ciceribacter sp. L1K22]
MGQQTSLKDDSVDRHAASRFIWGLARGGASALLFSLPMLMTMEMWALGVYLSRDKLLLLLLLNMPLLAVLSHRIGFEHTATWRQSIRDALVAYGIGIVASGAILVLFGVIKNHMPLDEIIGKIAVQAVPASIGALLGRSQLGTSDETEDDDEDTDRRTSYVSELFLMAIGALFLSLNIAPTEEMILVSYKMTYWHALVAILLSLAVMHGFVYAVSFTGGHSMEKDAPRWHAFVRFTLPGYAIALLISLYSLWTFERLNDSAMLTVAMSVIVLSMPAAIGAAAARLIL